MRRLLSTLFLFSLISQAKADCPSGSVASADGTRCFFFNSTLLPFQSAELNCQRRYGGHLASIQNGFDNNLLNNLNPSSPSTAYWIGGLKMDSADTNYFWTDGSEVSYTQWAVGQPVSSKMCIAHELATNNWQTRDCGESLPYVCAGASNATVPSTQPPPVQASKCDDGWTMFAYPYYEQPGNCYKVLTNQPGCTAAFSACTALGANVASVHSEAENGFLLGLTVPTGTKAGDDQQTCIGLQRVKENDNYVNTFQWSDGTAGDYCNWHQGYPTFAANNNCAILYSSYTDGKLVGKWSDFPCETNERTVVCKKRAN